MKTIHISHDEMERNVARFKSLSPITAEDRKQPPIPAEAIEMLTAKLIWPLMGNEPAGAAVGAQVPVWCPPGVNLAVIQCPPGNGPKLHAHLRTYETFFCLKGRFEITWNDEGQDSLILEEHDLISIPPLVCRAFRNVSNQDAMLLAMIQSVGGSDMKDVSYATSVGREIEQKYGSKTKEAFEAVGMTFEADMSR